MANKVSIGQAVKAMCFECIYDPIGGTGSKHDQTTNCPSTQCPLHPFRPISSKEKSARLNERLESMSESELAAYNENRARQQEKARASFGLRK